jgi:hypothetical protein
MTATTSSNGNNHLVNHRSNWREVYLFMFIGLPLLSVLFLYLEHATHFEFLLHLAAIPLEILLGAFLVERYLARKEKQAKRQQLMYIKSYLFRSELRNVYVRNFRALTQPAITMEDIALADLAKLRELRNEAKKVEYGSPEAMETVLVSYVYSQRIFRMFLEWSISNDFEDIFHDMLGILHFIQDVKLFKFHNPDRLFMEEAADKPELLAKVHEILHSGVIKFLDYAIELKEFQPQVFDEIMTDYRLSWNIAPEPANTPMRRKTDLYAEGPDLRGGAHPGMRMMSISP